jgi:hypothetical protein
MRGNVLSMREAIKYFTVFRVGGLTAKISHVCEMTPTRMRSNGVGGGGGTSFAWDDAVMSPHNISILSVLHICEEFDHGTLCKFNAGSA